jgi:hypothetical protein
VLKLLAAACLLRVDRNKHPNYYDVSTTNSILQASSFNNPWIIKPYAEVAPISFPEYSAEQRQLAADQVSIHLILLSRPTTCFRYMLIANQK